MDTKEPAITANSRRGHFSKVIIVLLVLIAVGVVFYLKDRKRVAIPTEAASLAMSHVDASSRIDANGLASISPSASRLPRLLDLGATKCVPCKMMAPILEQLKVDYAGRLNVEFIDVWENPDAGREYGVQIIPTQIFYDASGAERFRHQGFYSREDILAKWKVLGVDLGEPSTKLAEFSRLEPATPDSRPKEAVCYMCDGDIDPKTRTVLTTAKGDVRFCSPHCFFIAYSSMVNEKPPLDNIMVTDWSTGTLVPVTSAIFVYGIDKSNRPTIKAFKDRDVAVAEQQAAGGNVVEWTNLQDKELATRCGFCDRAVYPEDASVVMVEGLSTWGCCTMCALGVAARLQKDIQVTAKDALTGETIRVMTTDGHVGLLEPQSSVAWAGTKKDADGTLVSTGCFKQAFFANEANLRMWVDAHPTATGRMIPIEQALAEKLKLTPEQIGKACKIGECSPR